MNPVGDAVAIVAYAELRAVLLGWAGCAGWDPASRAWSATRKALIETVGPSVAVRACQVLRTESSGLLEGAARRAGPWPFDYRIGRGQIGTLAGLEATFHDAAAFAAVHRDSDPRVLSVAIAIADLMRARQVTTGPR